MVYKDNLLNAASTLQYSTHLGHVDIWLHINAILQQPPVWLGDQGEVVGGQFDIDSARSFLCSQLIRPGPDQEVRGPVSPPPGGSPADAVASRPAGGDRGAWDTGADVTGQLQSRHVTGDVRWRTGHTDGRSFNKQLKTLKK